MTLMFYPHSEDAQKGTLQERVEILMEAAERYKAVVLDTTGKGENEIAVKIPIPRELVAAYNWEEIARVLREVRDMPEASKGDKVKKATLITKLAEVYEVLRGAKMSKLEAVRLALIAEATQLKNGSSQVA